MSSSERIILNGLKESYEDNFLNKKSKYDIPLGEIPNSFNLNSYDANSGKFLIWSEIAKNVNNEHLTIFDPKTLEVKTLKDILPTISPISKSGYFVYGRESKSKGKTDYCIGNVNYPESPKGIVSCIDFSNAGGFSFDLKMSSNSLPYGTFEDIFYYLDDTNLISGNKGNWVFVDLKENKIIKKIPKKKLDRILPNTIDGNKILGIKKETSLLSIKTKETLVSINEKGEIEPTDYLEKGLGIFKNSNPDGWLRGFKEEDENVNRFALGQNMPEYFVNFKTGKKFSTQKGSYDMNLSIGGDYITIVKFSDTSSYFLKGLEIISANNSIDSLNVSFADSDKLMFGTSSFNELSSFGRVLLKNEKSLKIIKFKEENSKWIKQEINLKKSEFSLLNDDSMYTFDISFSKDGKFTIINLEPSEGKSLREIIILDDNSNIVYKGGDPVDKLKHAFFIENDIVTLDNNDFSAQLNTEMNLNAFNVLKKPIDSMFKEGILLGENAVKLMDGSIFFGVGLKSKLNEPTLKNLNDYGKKLTDANEEKVEIEGKLFNKSLILKNLK